MGKKGTGNFVVGDLMKEIQDQDLMAPVGGSTDSSETHIISLISLLTVWSNEIITKKFGCGLVFTVSAECRSDGKPC